MTVTVTVTYAQSSIMTSDAANTAYLRKAPYWPEFVLSLLVLSLVTLPGHKMQTSNIAVSNVICI